MNKKVKKRSKTKSELPINILLVEDNPGDARLMAEMLADSKNEKFVLHLAKTLKEACNILRGQNISVVLLDLSLPDSAGISTYDRIHERAKDIPIIILTGLKDESLALMAMKKGAQDYLVKGEISGSLITRSILYSIERYRMALVEVALRREKNEREELERELKSLKTISGGGSRKSATPLLGKKLTKSIAEGFSLRYVDLIKIYTSTKNLDNENPAINRLCEDFIEYGISPKGIIDIHLKSVPQVGAIGGLETSRITFESRMVLLAVMTKYANLLRKKPMGG